MRVFGNSGDGVSVGMGMNLCGMSGVHGRMEDAPCAVCWPKALYFGTITEMGAKEVKTRFLAANKAYCPLHDGVSGLKH